MEKPHFEVIFVPKTHGNVIGRLEAKLKRQDELREEVTSILEKEGIVPTKIYITKVEEGKGKNKVSDIFEGFTWKKYWGKVRGEKKGFFRDTLWKNDFYIYVLYGKKKDGIIFTVEDATTKEIKNIGKRIHERILRSMKKEGPINWGAVQRIGTVE